MARGWLCSADLRYHWGIYNVGLCYDRGDGVHKDRVKAVEWYRKAAAQNHAGACPCINRPRPEHKRNPMDTSMGSLFILSISQKTS